jgi:hypothetical protein
MRDARGQTSRPWAPQPSRHEAQSPEAKRPQDDRVFFVLATVPRLDVSRFSAASADATRGAPPFAPPMRVGVLLEAYGGGGFSSRQSAQACARTLACMAMVGAERPDGRPSSAVRQRHLDAFGAVCVAGLRSAGAAGRGQVGQVATAGPQRQGKASRPKALRSGFGPQAVARLREALAAWGTQASQHAAQDAAALGRRRGAALPAALARRAARVATRAAARHRVEARANAAAEAERTRRAAAAAARPRPGQPRRGQAPTEGAATPADQAQSSCPAPARGSMPTTNTGWASGGKAPVSGEAASQSLGACDVTAAATDTPPAVPLAPRPMAPWAQAGRKPPKDATGAAPKLPGPADSGDASAPAAAAGAPWGCAPALAPGRQRPQGLAAAVAAAPTPAKERMAAQGQRAAGRARDARRTVIVAPGGGQSKDARGFRRFWLRGWAKMRGAWCLVGVTQNLLQVWRYACAPCTVSAVAMGPHGPPMDFAQTPDLTCTAPVSPP